MAGEPRRVVTKDAQAHPASALQRKEEPVRTKSAVMQAFSDVGNLLRPTTIKEFLGIKKTEEEEREVMTRLFALQSFMEGFDAHVAKSNDDKIKGYLIAKRLIGKAMTHMEKIGIGRIDEIERAGYKDYIGRHEKFIDEQLARADAKMLKRIKEEMKEYDTNGTFATAASKSALSDAIWMERKEAYKFGILGTGSYLVGLASALLGAHFDRSPFGEFFAVGMGAALGGGTHALIKAREHWGKMKLSKRLQERINHRIEA